MAIKYDMSPTSAMFGEYEHFNLLFAKGNEITTTGIYSFTSSTSGETYSSATGGEMDVLGQLKTALNNYMMLATDFNGKAEISDLTSLSNVVASHKAENAAQFNAIEIKLSDYNSYASDPDETGIYTIVDYKRANGTLYMKSTLSGGESPNYTTDTWQFYDKEGTTVIATKTWTLSYDESDKIISKVVA